MEVDIRELTSTQEVLNRALVTVWKDESQNAPRKAFLADMYLSEHSPIRDRLFVISIRGIKSWVATHFVRHHEGFTPYVSTQRDDRLEYYGSRDDKRQGELVNMDITINAQAFINVSRKRLCGKAHAETQVVWQKVLNKLKEIDPELHAVCVPECVYRGVCPEKDPCGRTESKTYREMRKRYVGDRPIIEF